MFHNKLIVFALLLTGCTFICAAATAQLDVSLANDRLPHAESTTEDLEKKTTSTTTLAPTTSTTVSTTSSATTTTPATTTATSTTPEPTTAAPTTTSTSTTPTAAPDTSTTTTTTAAPDTTTTTTTTAAPDTTTMTTTTAAPDTTTAPPPAPTPTTPAPAPAPYPEPSIGQWNSSCILVKLGAQLNLTYKTKDKNTNTTLYNIPVDSVVDHSMCNNTTQTMQINWGPAEAQHSMLLQFNQVNKSSVLTMLRFEIPVIGDRFPNALENQTLSLLHRGSDFDAPMQMSYHCTRPQLFNLTDTVIDKQTVGTVTVHDVQVEAFRKPNNSTVFSTARDCDSAETPDIVPIAVGIALVAMIMIILISYLCARRRSTSRGYMSF